MSDLGRLAECLVDNDPAARVRARRLRGKALVLSVVLEAALLAAMFVWPLIAPGVLTAHYIVTPAPPYSGGGPAHHLTLIKINVRRLRGARWSRRTNHRCNPRRIVHKHRGHYAFAHACRSHARRFRTWRRKRRTGPAGHRTPLARRNGRSRDHSRTELQIVDGNPLLAQAACVVFSDDLSRSLRAPYHLFR